MPLYIKDPEVDTLTEELIRLTKTSKVDAVKTALRREIASRKGSLPMRERLAKSSQWRGTLVPLRRGITNAKPMKCGAKTDAVR